MASITQYRGTTWRAIIRRKGFLPKSKTFALKREAERWAAEEEAKQGVGKFDALQTKQAKVTLVKRLFDRYAEEVAPGMKGKTEVATVKRLASNAEFMGMRLDKLTASHIREWRDCRAMEVSGASVNRELNTMSAVFRHAIKEWSVPLGTNPCHLVSAIPGADKPRDKMWSEEDTQTFLTTCKWDESKLPKVGRDYVPWALLLGRETAMRVGELCLLTVGDFYPELRYVHLKHTKNGDQRDVPLSLKAMRWLTHLCTGKKPGDKIFPLNANTMNEYVLDVRRKCGLEHLRMHDSRHTAATMLSRKLPNVLELAAVTGHRSLKSLQRYFHPDPSHLAGKLD